MDEQETTITAEQTSELPPTEAVEETPDKVPKSIGIPKDMREAFTDLNLKTPFSTWANAKLWDAIEQERKAREAQ